MLRFKIEETYTSKLKWLLRRIEKYCREIESSAAREHEITDLLAEQISIFQSFIARARVKERQKEAQDAEVAILSLSDRFFTSVQTELRMRRDSKILLKRLLVLREIMSTHNFKYPAARTVRHNVELRIQKTRTFLDKKTKKAQKKKGRSKKSAAKKK